MTRIAVRLLVCAAALFALVSAAVEQVPEQKPLSLIDRLKGLTNQADELALLNKPDCVITLTGGIDGVERTLMEQIKDDRLWMIMIASKHDASSVAATEQFYDAVRAFCEPAAADSEAKDATGDPIQDVEQSEREKVMQQYRFALLNFDDESQLTWRWWIWKIPIVLFITRSTEPTERSYDVQFWKIAWQIPNANRLIGAIKELAWRDQLPVWDTAFTPGGKLDVVSRLYAHFFNGVYDLLDPIPRWLLALLGSMAGSMLLTYLHRNDNAQQKEQATQAKKIARGGGGGAKKTQ